MYLNYDSAYDRKIIEFEIYERRNFIMDSQKHRRSSYLFILTLILFTLSADRAYAYLDPAAGSVILQIILGGVAGIALLAKFYWRKIRGLFMRDQKE